MDLCSLFDPSWSSRNAILCLFDVSGVSLSQYLEGDGGVPGSLVYKECQSQDAVIIVGVSEYSVLESIMSDVRSQRIQLIMVKAHCWKKDSLRPVSGQSQASLRPVSGQSQASLSPV